MHLTPTFASNNARFPKATFFHNFKVNIIIITNNK